MIFIKKGSVTVNVGDLDRAVKFYNETLGLKLKSKMGKEYAELEVFGLTLGLHATSKQFQKHPAQESPLSIGLEVNDLDRTMNELRSKGVSFEGSVSEEGPLKIAFFGDPDGNPLYLAEIKKGLWG